MTSTRDKAVSIFLSLIKDPYYQESKDKSREEVVWLESQQRARQAQNNEIALSMAASDSSEAVKALLRHLVKASALMTVDDYDEDDSIKTFMAQDADGNFIGGYGELSGRYKQTYRYAVGIDSTRSQSRQAAIADILDMVEEYPELKIPITEDFGDEFKDDEPAKLPASLSSLPKGEQLALFDGNEDNLEAALNREQDKERQTTWATQQTGRARIRPEPFISTLTPEEQEERNKANAEAIRNLSGPTPEEKPEIAEPIGKTYSTSTGKNIALSAYNLQPTQFLDLETDANELAAMSNLSDSYGIPIPGETLDSERPFIPVRLINSITTGGHRRYPFNAFIKKLEGDLGTVRDSISDWFRGDASSPYHLLGRDANRGQAGFQNYFEDMVNRKARMEDGSERALADSDIKEHLDNVENLAGAFSNLINQHVTTRKPNPDTMEKMSLAYNKSLTLYSAAIERLKESMSDNAYLDVAEDDIAGYRTEKFEPEVSAELLRLQFLEDASSALGNSSITPFSDFIGAFRFSPDEYDDVIKDKSKRTEKDRHGQEITGQHWDNPDNIAKLLSQVKADYIGRLPEQIANHLTNEDGSEQSITDWQPTVVSQVEHINPEGDWFTAINHILTGSRKLSEAVRIEQKSSGTRQSYGGKLGAQINQLWRVSQGLAPVERSGSGKPIDPVAWAEEIGRLRRLEGEIPGEDEEGDVSNIEQERIIDAFNASNNAISNPDLDILDETSEIEEEDEPIDEELVNRLKDNFNAFIQAIMKDDKAERGEGINLRADFVGPDKAFNFNPETDELEWNSRRFGSSTVPNLDEIRDLIQNVLLPRNPPPGGDTNYRPQFRFTGTAAEEVFRKGRIIPTNPQLMIRLREYIAEQLGEHVAPDDVRVDEYMANLNTPAPGTFGKTYKDLITNTQTKNEINDVGMKTFLSDIVMPLVEESKEGVPSGLSPDALREHINASQAMNRFWAILENQGDGDISSESLVSDIAVAMHPSMVRAEGTLREKGIDRLEEEDITTKVPYGIFITELKNMLDPRTGSKASRDELDAIVSNLAVKLLQEVTSMDYDSDNPEPYEWTDVIQHEVPPNILNTIRTALENPEYGIKALRSSPPSFSNLLQWQMTRAGGYDRWAAENEEPLSFFKELLGNDIFNTWSGQRKFKHIIKGISSQFPPDAEVEFKHQFGLNDSGQMSLDVLQNLYEILRIPNSSEEWEATDHTYITSSGRFGDTEAEQKKNNPFEELRGKREGGQNPFSGVTPETMQRIINHFYGFRQSDFDAFTRQGTTGISNSNPRQAAFLTLGDMITTTAINGLGSGLQMGQNAETLVDQVREDLQILQLSRPFNARGYPINNGSPAHMDDYVHKLLSVLKELEGQIIDLGPEKPWASMVGGVEGFTGSVRHPEGDLTRRIKEIEDNYIHSKEEDSWRNQFHRDYWQGWMDDSTLAESDPKLQKHIYDMHSDIDTLLPYQTSVHLNSLFSLEKLLQERGYDQAVTSGNVSAEQALWITNIIRTVSNSYSDMSKIVNNVSGLLKPEHQKELVKMFFKTPDEGDSYQDTQQISVLIADSMDDLRAGEASYENFDELFPDMSTSKVDAPIPKEVIKWMQSDKDYGDDEDPSKGEYESKQPMLAEDASGDPDDKNYLKPHPNYVMDSFERRLLTSRPWQYGTRTPIAEARKLITEKDPETKQTILENFRAQGERWKKYAQTFNPFTDDTSEPVSTERSRNVGAINHSELYDQIANTPTRYGMIHPHEEGYNTEATPHLGAQVKGMFSAADMLDENGQYTPEAHAYMNTLPKAKHETSPDNHMIPTDMTSAAIKGFKQGFTPAPPQEPGTEGTEGMELSKARVSVVTFPGAEGSGDDEEGGGQNIPANEVLKAHPMFQNQNSYATLKQAFHTVGEGSQSTFDDAAFQEWFQKYNLPVHPEAPEGSYGIEIPFLVARPQPDSIARGRLSSHELHKNFLRDIGEHGGGVSQKRAILGRLYSAQNSISKSRNRKAIPANAGGPASRPQWEVNADYKMGINQQWISMLENQLVEHAIEQGTHGLNPDDENFEAQVLEGLDISHRSAYEKNDAKEANVFRGYMSRWAVEHGLPSDSEYDHDTMKEFLGTLTDGRDRPLYEKDPKTGVEHFRFRSFPFKKEEILRQFAQIHNNLFVKYGLNPDTVFEDIKNQEAKVVASPEPTPTPPPGRTQIIETRAGQKVDTFTGEIIDDGTPTSDTTEGTGTIEGTGEERPSDPRTGSKFKQPRREAAEPKYPKDGHAWKRIRQHLLDTTNMDEEAVDLDMGVMDEADLKQAWQSYSKARQKTEQAKPKPEVSGMEEETKQKYVDTIREHSHEMHGTDIHGDDKFDDMSDKQLSDAYHSSHKEVSTHRAKQAASGKQNYANDIVTRLSALPDGATEDKILNQARSLTSEFLNHRTIFDKSALSHWQTMMQDLKAKATEAGVDWAPLIDGEIDKYQDRFGSPEHLEEVNETKRQQQQQQAEYTGTLDARYAQAQQHPEYKPGHFITFLRGRDGTLTPRGFDYNNPMDRDYDDSALDDLGEPPVFEDSKGNTSLGMYHPHSESWINPFVYDRARKNMLDKNKNPHLQSTSVIRNGRQWTNTHKYDDDVNIEEKHAFAIPTQKKQAELEQRNQNQMGYMIGTDGNIVGLDSDWNNVLNSRDMSQEQSPNRIVQDYHIRQLQQQHDQNPEYIGTRREAPIVTPKSPQAQQAQARSQQPPKQEGTAIERFAQRQEGTSSAKPYSFNPQDFMTEREKNLQDIGGFFSDAGGAVGRSAFRAMRMQNPFKHTPDIEDYWKDRTKEYETQNQVNELYHTMHTQYFGSKPAKPFYGSDAWSKQRAANEALGYDTTGQGQGQYGSQPDQFTETQPQTPPVYGEQTQPKPPSEVGDALSRLR